MNTIAICDKDEDIIVTYKSDAVPRVGELINFPHKGTFRILAVAHRVSDDAIWREDERLLYIEVIIDITHPVTEFS